MDEKPESLTGVASKCTFAEREEIPVPSLSPATVRYLLAEAGQAERLRKDIGIPLALVIRRLEMGRYKEGGHGDYALSYAKEARAVLEAQDAPQ